MFKFNGFIINIVSAVLLLMAKACGYSNVKIETYYDTTHIPVTVPFNDTIPFYYPVPYADTFVFNMPKDSLVINHIDSVSEISGVIIESYGANKIIKGDYRAAKFEIYMDSIRVLIHGDTITRITEHDTIKIKADGQKKFEI